MFLEVMRRTDLQTLKGKLVERSIEKYEIQNTVFCVAMPCNSETARPSSRLKSKPPRHQAHPKLHAVTTQKSLS
jgi:hypothetical protein